MTEPSAPPVARYIPSKLWVKRAKDQHKYYNLHVLVLSQNKVKYIRSPKTTDTNLTAIEQIISTLAFLMTCGLYASVSHIVRYDGGGLLSWTGMCAVQSRVLFLSTWVKYLSVQMTFKH